jgi:MFS family permease
LTICLMRWERALGFKQGGAVLSRNERQLAQSAFTESEREVLSRRELLELSFLWFALTFHFAAMLPIVIPAQILQFVTPGVVGSARQALVLGVLAAVGACTSLVLQPTIGALSDRTRTRLGRRRPYILGGGIVLLAGLIMLALTHEVLPFIAGLFLVVVANTVSGAAYQGLVPDRVPAKQRGIASGYMGVMTILGTVGSLAVASLLLGQAQGHGHVSNAGIQLGASLYYALGAGVLFTSMVVTLLAVREEPHMRAAPWPAGGSSVTRKRLARLWLEPWHHPNFLWVFLTRCFVMLGLVLFMTFIEYYFAQVAHIASFLQATALNTIMALLGALSITLVLGSVSDRMQRRVPLVCGATALMALAALTFVVAPGKLPLWPLGIVFGLGYGGYTSVDWALAIDALPSAEEAGKDLGIWSMASTLPAVVAPALGSLVIVGAAHFGATALGYRAVFALATLFLIVGGIFVLKVQET